MTVQSLRLRPGVVLDETYLAATGYAVDADKVRWWLGRAQAMGGYSTLETGLSGYARSIYEWALNDGTPVAAIGTHKKLYVYSTGRLLDITPQRSSGTYGNNPLATTNGSATVTVTHASHGAATGDTVYIKGAATVATVQVGGISGTMSSNAFTSANGSNRVTVNHTAHGLADNDIVYFSGASDFGGITAATYINVAGGLRVQVVTADVYWIWVGVEATSSASGGGTPTYEYAKPYAITVVNGNSYTITASSSANATTTGGGAGVDYSYDITIGAADGGESGGGYGGGAYGGGLYGIGAGTSTAPVRPRLWSLAAWGEDLIANICGAAIYLWDASAPSSRAATLTNAPARCNAVVVTPQRSILALGCTGTGGTFDPLIIRHCSLESNTTWSPAVTNSAGEERASEGTRLVGGLVTSFGTIVWTDTATYEMEYVGNFDQVYRPRLLAADGGLLTVNAAQESGGAVYWLDQALMFRTFDGGRPRLLPAPVHTWLVDRINIGQADKVVAVADRTYPAVMWLFPSDSAENDRYLRFDHEEARSDPMAGWSPGTFDRGAWSTRRAFRNSLAMSSTGTLYEHESEFGADGVAIDRYIEFAPLEVETSDQPAGETVAHINRVILDATRSETFEVTIKGKDYPADDDQTIGPYEVQTSDRYQDVRISTRQSRLRIDASTSTFWRLGLIRVDVSAKTQR